MRIISTLLLPTLLFAVPCSNAQALSLATVLDVNSQVKTLPVPTDASTPFEHWTYNTALQTAIYCWNKASEKNHVPPMPDFLYNYRPTMGGSFTMPSDSKIDALCESVATDGIHPVCTGSFVQVSGLNRPSNWPLEYISLPKDYSQVKLGGTLHCFLNAKQIQQQSYPTDFSFEWLEQPAPTSINTESGAKQAVSGTIQIKEPYANGLEGKPYTQVKRVIVE